MLFRPSALLAALALALAVSTAGVTAPRAPDLKPVGQYGDVSAPVTLFERDGALFLDRAGRVAARLDPVAPGRFRVEGGGELVVRKRALQLDGAFLPRRDFGAQVEAGIRRGVRADPVTLRTRALAATPPVETADHRPADLVDLAGLDPTIRFDIRYAGRNNFMGLKLYERPAAYLQRPAAEALGRVHRALATKGYGLLIHDAYRPWFVTWMFWEATPAESHSFVADPAKGSRHNRGCAVDLTLYDLKTGKVVEMPGRYDEMSARSYADFVGGTTAQRARRQILREAMAAEGFEVLPEEWWHFDYKDWRSYGIGTRTFTALASGR
ncbi:M15 family metallopeptidase [Caulobacter henricii]|uniref:M15 family metallopeptidase n=1 Tax=Caulobacter henricii TaxID=69395 RepID=UPI000A0585B6|nr:M15 family metallopeptidase [Caulobacter henricii]